MTAAAAADGSRIYRYVVYFIMLIAFQFSTMWRGCVTYRLTSGVKVISYQ